LQRATSLVVVVVIVVLGDDLPGLVVSVLLRVEHAPAEMERPGEFGAEQPANRWITIRHMDASDLIVAVVLKTRAAEQCRVYRR
jgi:hypothetical protein